MKWEDDMLEENAAIKENRRIADGIYRLKLRTSIARTAVCGQFVEVRVPGFFLRRPISICSIEEEEIILIYKTVGAGTNAMVQMKEGGTINVFGPLGHGFPVIDRDVLLIGGGVGLPPLYETARQYRRIGKNVTVCAGFNTKEDIFLKEEFDQLGCAFFIATMDGSDGTKGTVLDAIRENHIEESFVLACGPKPMLKAVSDQYKEGYISLESRMACGIGACNGCVVKDQTGNSLRVCADGPVFPIGKVVF